MDALTAYGSDDDSDGSTVESKSTVIPILNETQARQEGIFARSVPHTVGNWAGHIYLDLDWAYQEEKAEVDSDNDTYANEWVECRRRWTERLQDHLQRRNLPIKALVVHENCHVSLSKTFYLQHYNIESFVSSLRTALHSSVVKSSLTLRVDGNPTLVLSKLLDLPNGEQKRDQSRTFWCAQVHPPLLDLVKTVDAVLKDTWKLPVFYDPPLFHTSWASAPGDWTTPSTPLPALFEESFFFTIQHVTCRIGDKIFRIPLDVFHGSGI